MHFFPRFNHWLTALDDPRDSARCTYETGHLLWLGLLMMLGGMRSRLQLLSDGSRPGFHENLLALSGTGEAAAAHPDTLDYLLQKLDPAQLCGLNARLAGRLIRMRCLDRFRMDGEWLVAVDAVELRTYSKRHCEHCLSRRLSNGRMQYFHSVLEARLVTAAGLTVSLTSVPICNSGTSYDKQDCELKAFPRLADELKRRFPKLPMCLLGDSLYGCEPVLRICREKQWSYIIVFKKGRTPLLWERARKKRDRRPSNRATGKAEDGTVQHFSWATCLDHGQETVHAVFCEEERPGGTISNWAWITDHRPRAGNIETLTNKGGRLRWKIENEGFNSLKNGEIGLKHDYGSLGNAWYNYYLMAQTALLFIQLMWHGDLVKKITAHTVDSTRKLFRTIRNMCLRIRESLQADRLATGSSQAAFQIRFNTS